MQIGPPPPSFRIMALNVKYDALAELKSIEEAAEYALNGIDQKDALELRSYLATLINANVSDKELSEFWSQSPSSMFFSNGAELRRYLETILKTLSRGPYVA